MTDDAHTPTTDNQDQGVTVPADDHKAQDQDRPEGQAEVQAQVQPQPLVPEPVAAPTVAANTAPANQELERSEALPAPATATTDTATTAPSSSDGVQETKFETAPAGDLEVVNPSGDAAPLEPVLSTAAPTTTQEPETLTTLEAPGAAPKHSDLHLAACGATPADASVQVPDVADMVLTPSRCGKRQLTDPMTAVTPKRMRIVGAASPMVLSS